MDWTGRRVTVMGLGRFGGGAAAARWAARQGARVTLTDRTDADSLADAVAALADAPIEAVHLGGHNEDDFRRADVVIVNPAVRPNNPLLRLAQQSGAELATEMGLFLERCPAAVVGVTGSNGKSTTAAMIAAILQVDGRRTWLGGNIGRSLLDDLGQIRPDDWVVLELSSFQLCHLDARTPVPRVAVATNFTPNHLDWHSSVDDYRQAKQRLLLRQSPEGLVALGADLADDPAWTSAIRGRLLPPVDPAAVPPLRVPGEHNRANALLAATVAAGVGCAREAIGRALTCFAGLPGRLEVVAEPAGRFLINDTTATTPESAIAALAALDRPVWLLAGGSDKGVDLGPMAEAIAARTRGAAFFGVTGPRLFDAVARRKAGFPACVVSTMAEALAWCWQQSRPGDAVLLSPGCASHDQFANFEHRGRVFVELAGRLPPLAASHSPRV
ncbi:MAG: UDP-N-acetylmuramoyl-L-alanine--D-glutamate ligase [Pirellulales bacterium]|nr:UDP-N-acetylmuramoyl-L-alanine--D-glutamate ligase [Pirellulales bacterium]